MRKILVLGAFAFVGWSLWTGRGPLAPVTAQVKSFTGNTVKKVTGKST